jgi:hypothetical protein
VQHLVRNVPNRFRVKNTGLQLPLNPSPVRRHFILIFFGRLAIGNNRHFFTFWF